MRRFDSKRLEVLAELALTGKDPDRFGNFWRAQKEIRHKEKTKAEKIRRFVFVAVSVVTALLVLGVYSLALFVHGYNIGVNHIP